MEEHLFFHIFVQGFLLMAFLTPKIQGLPFTLSSANSSLLRHRYALVASYQPVYHYTYDTSANNQITDGGKDMYDVGNQVSVYENNTLSVEKIEYNKTYDLANAQLTSLATIPFTTLLKIDNEDAQPLSYSLQVAGRGSKDDEVFVSHFSGNTSDAEFNIQFLAFQASGKLSPSICEIYYVIYSKEVWSSIPPKEFTGDFSFDPYKFNNTVTIFGTPSRILMGYSLFSRYPPSPLTEDELLSTVWSIVAVLASGDYLAAYPHLRGYISRPGFVVEDGECSFESHDCHVNAMCRGIEDRYSCKCNSGFFGDGYTCTDNSEDIDQCMLGTHNCHANATCTNLPGEFKCTCIQGFEGDGKKCRDIDECFLNRHKCHKDAKCKNTEGKYACDCKPGFNGNGYSCKAKVVRSVNKLGKSISDETCSFLSHNCHSNATCLGTQERFSCRCKPGFQGNGYTCAHVTGVHTTAADRHPLKKIVPEALHTIDECILGIHNCHPNSTCINTLSGFKCVCMEGLEGDGVTCEDIDECAINTHKCDTNATCTNLERSYRCTCDYGLGGNGFSCGGYTTVCLADRMTFEISSAYFSGSNVGLKDFFLNDFKCQGTTKNTSPDIWVFDVRSLSSCGTKLSKNATHLTYSNTLENWVYTSAAQMITFSCSYEIDLKNLTFLSTHYGVIKNVANITARAGRGQYVATLNRYTDSTHAEVDTRNEYKTTDTLYIMIDLQTMNNNLNLVIDKCWVTPTTSKNDQYMYTFIDHCCPIEGKVGHVNITRSGRGPVAHFETKVIAFVNYDATFLHCSLKICSPEEGKSCIPACESQDSSLFIRTMTKRDVADEHNEDEVVSIGPLVVSKDDDTPVTVQYVITTAIFIGVVFVFASCLSMVACWICGNRHQRKDMDA